MENKYILADLQDLAGDKREETLDGAKEFLANHWEELDEDDSFFEEIDRANFDELNEMLAGIDYELFETEEDYLQAVEDMKQARKLMKCS
jgi:hypothetical protein